MGCLKALVEKQVVPVYGFPVKLLLDLGELARLLPKGVDLFLDKGSGVLSLAWGKGDALWEKCLSVLLSPPLTRTSVLDVRFYMAIKLGEMSFPMESFALSCPSGIVYCYTVRTLPLKKETTELVLKTFYCRAKSWNCTLLVPNVVESGKVGFFLWGEQGDCHAVATLLGATFFFWREDRGETSVTEGDSFCGASSDEIGEYQPKIICCWQMYCFSREQLLEDRPFWSM